MMDSAAIKLLRPVFTGFLLLSFLAGCSSLRIGTEGIRTAYCGTDQKPGLYAPVEWSRQDTDETIRQTKANNAVYLDMCR